MANDVTSKVLLGLDAKEFRRGIQQVDAKLKETSKLFGNLGQAIGAAFIVGQVQAFAAETIKLGSELQTVGRGGKMGTAVDTAADKMVRLTTTWENFKAKFGEAIAPAASGLLEGITNMLKAGETMGPALNRLGVATGTAKPSNLVKKQGATTPAVAPVVEMQRAITTLETLRQNLKDLEAEYNTAEVGTRRFMELRQPLTRPWKRA
jgi:hypothetical protein